MIDVGSLLEPGRVLVGGGAVGALVAARYMWTAAAFASVLRTGAIILALMAVGALTGVVDLARLAELVQALMSVVAGGGGPA